MQCPLNSDIESRTPSLRTQFRDAAPFSHLISDNFLDESFARRLYEEFPPFADERAISEHGTVGGKATRENMRELGPAFAELDKYFSSQPFLDWMSQVTGIPDLLYDPDYFGGGTHENMPGQDMSVHVDFNYHPTRGWHRRVNALIYLNPVWEENWGGALELWENPWSPPSKNTIVKVAPIWNRMVLFATSEKSWHGFEAVSIPEPARGRVRSRKSIALYLYTKDRPPAETGAMHSTIYYERPLPETIRPEKVISRADWNEMTRLTARRDDLLKLLYAREARFNTLISELSRRPDPNASGDPDSLPAQVSRLQLQLRERTQAARHLRGALLAAAAGNIPSAPLLFAPSTSELHMATKGFWPMGLLGPGAQVRAKRCPPQAGHWSLVRVPDHSELQLVFLARELPDYFLALQPTNPGSLLVPRSAVYGKVTDISDQAGDPLYLPERLRLRFRQQVLHSAFLLFHRAKDAFIGNRRSRWLWRTSVIYRRLLSRLGVQVPIIPPR